LGISSLHALCNTNSVFVQKKTALSESIKPLN